jgi:anti-sigma regulatory factor (Ser/Thr protein kinase)
MPSPAPRALALRTTSAIYPGSAEHISAVRTDLRALLGDCPLFDDVILCASELAANAVLHSHSGLPGGTFTVRAIVNPGHYVRIDVEDDGGPWTPAVRDPLAATAKTSSAFSPARGVSTVIRPTERSGRSSTGRLHEQPGSA